MYYPTDDLDTPPQPRFLDDSGVSGGYELETPVGSAQGVVGASGNADVSTPNNGGANNNNNNNSATNDEEEEEEDDDEEVADDGTATGTGAGGAVHGAAGHPPPLPYRSPKRLSQDCQSIF